MARKPFDPEAVLAAIARGERACGDFAMRIDREGTWHYQGSPIRRLPLVKLFATVLRRAPDGSYWLVTPVEQGRIEVEDVPFVVVELRSEGEGPAQRIELRTNLDEWVPLDAAHPLRLAPALDGARIPYVTVRDQLEARVSRSVFYHLVELAEPAPDGHDDVVGVWSAGRFFPLGSVDG
ncbi:DUF1285 domain-containing protein [Benzoatithermus flavus]|uniref:DUF1285 domain-containing protein n=1 Tax=Benzoatithermus flavus TaxID=3108223 RepID=A0ABU8XNJ5_9PROT